MTRFRTQPKIGDELMLNFSPFKRGVVWQQPINAKLCAGKCKIFLF